MHIKNTIYIWNKAHPPKQTYFNFRLKKLNVNERTNEFGDPQLFLHLNISFSLSNK